MKKLILLVSLTALLLSCCKGPYVKAPSDVTVTIDATECISEDFVGSGVQWDPYELNYGNGMVNISDADWEKLYTRLDGMHPAFMRVVFNSGWMKQTDDFDQGGTFPQLVRILEYCQSRGVYVMLGDWGWGLVDANTGEIDETMLERVAKMTAWLINVKGFDCIKCFNVVNEPNGDWAATRGDFDLWARVARLMEEKLTAQGLDLKLAGPDTALWEAWEAFWVSRTADELDDLVSIYDIHTYPNKYEVNNGIFTEVLNTFKAEVPAGKKVVVGEIGLKYTHANDSVYITEAERRIAARDNVAVTDSQMFVYDYMYGTDVLDALFQAINAGYSGFSAWMLDDAMHNGEAPGKLKIWGFWNILGDEVFGPEEELIRPWYYAWSLACRFIPAGSDALRTAVEGNKYVRAVCTTKDGKRTVALLNVSKEPADIKVRSESLGVMKNVYLYRYGDGLVIKDGECGYKPAGKVRRIDLTNGKVFNVPAESLLLLTELD